MPEDPNNKAHKDYNQRDDSSAELIASDYSGRKVSLLDLFLLVLRRKRVILYTIGFCMIIGLFIALFASPEYKSSATLIREIEAQETGIGGFSSLSRGLGGLGINLGIATTGLTAEAYPDIIKSREVRLAVVRDEFYFSELGDTLTLTDYFDGEASIISRILNVPGKFIESFKKEPAKRAVINTSGESSYPSEAEELAMKVVSEMLAVNIDRGTGLMSIDVTTEDPLFSAKLAESFIEHLKDRIRGIKTQKARDNLDFVQERFVEAEVILRQAEKQLANFLDRNTNPQTAELRTEQQRLQRHVNFKSQLYSDLQTQLTQAEIELQRSEPVITVLEEPVPPMDNSKPNRMLTVIISLFIGSVLGISVAFFQTTIDNLKEDEEEREKIQEIKEHLIPAR
ncbi:MAG: hypothetical protein K9N46_08220 [Candidatus Marinimicrobia bacterium]|nr:hypothetical protein [Candidatus Neomarinimicrobiota bacterium]MCF7828792.1 hypothetical protein [Candidatus Neomarinimicrobiota bacterium]MCF7880709.1 hypothetical protein [Candidatus Neomarinimicrobiota bacterium]